MRGPTLVLVLLATSLAGCVDDPEPTPTESDPSSATQHTDPLWNDTDRIPLLQGTYRWHDPGNDPLFAYALATQQALHPCLFRGPDDERAEPYFNNLQLTTRPPDQYVPNGTTHLEITFTWDALDYDGDTLWPTYIGGNASQYRVGPPVPNGAPTVVPISNETWEPGPTSNWDIWVCVAPGDAAINEASAFRGSLDVEIQLARITPE